MRTGEEVGRFPSGDSPHENVYSRDGETIFHASIGLVYTPLDRPAMDSTKGERYFQLVDADTSTVTRRIDMGKELDEAGVHGDAVVGGVEQVLLARHVLDVVGDRKLDHPPDAVLA